jgi:hypothetical protein
LSTGERLVDWVTLRIQELPDGSVTSCSVRVDLSPAISSKNG